MSLLQRTLGDPALLPFAHSGPRQDVVLIHGAMTCLDDMAIGLFASLPRRFGSPPSTAPAMVAGTRRSAVRLGSRLTQSTPGCPRWVWPAR
jgi:hypothetical protein